MIEEINGPPSAKEEEEGKVCRTADDGKIKTEGGREGGGGRERGDKMYYYYY